MNLQAEAVVAGHICLDIIPGMEKKSAGLDVILVPGRMAGIGPAVISTGGAVSNTGLALHRLGVRTRLMGKVGRDAFGRTILDILNGYDPSLTEHMIVSENEDTSYSIVISPPGEDRVILHCTGANDSFTADDIDYGALDGARLFHFGYPPAMERMYSDGGAELATIFRRAKKLGLTTTLDTCVPDPETGSGRAPWRKILERVLPHVDVYLPSIEELLYMIDRDELRRLEKEHGAANVVNGVTASLLNKLGGDIISMGAAVAVIKLGGRGLYAKTTGDPARLKNMGRCAPANIEDWTGRELCMPCFKVNVAGTTGSGDCTAAGFLTGVLKGFSLEKTMEAALAVGACNVEKPDAVSGVPAWEVVAERIDAGWERHKQEIIL